MKYVVSLPATLDNGHTRTVVTCYPTEGAPFIEDFVCNVQPVGERIVTNARGDLLVQQGTRQRYIAVDDLDPEVEYEFVRETYQVDVAAVLRENIERFLHGRREDGYSNAERIEAGELRGSRVSHVLERRLKAVPDEFVRTPEVVAIADVEHDVPVDREAVGRLRWEQEERR